VVVAVLKAVLVVQGAAVLLAMLVLLELLAQQTQVVAAVQVVTGSAGQLVVQVLLFFPYLQLLILEQPQAPQLLLLVVAIPLLDSQALVHIQLKEIYAINNKRTNFTVYSGGHGSR
jgi:hypothetical protein